MMTAPISSIKMVIDYLWESEQQSFAEYVSTIDKDDYPKEQLVEHIFEHLLVIKHWLDKTGG